MTNITGIVLDLKNFVGGDQPSMQYIGKALREFRDSGKPVYAVGSSYSRGQYYGELRQQNLALAAGASRPARLRYQRLITKSLLDKLKVSTHVFRVGTYKSAVEPFIRDDMSPAAREAIAAGLANCGRTTSHCRHQITPSSSRAPGHYRWSA